MRFGLLGNLEVDVDGAPIDVGGTQPRTVLAMLLVAGGRVVPAESIIEALWGEDPPDSALGTLQSYVSRLRRALVPGGARGDAAKVLAWEPPGYKLVVGASVLDTRRFEALADRGRALLIAGDPDGARQLLGEALALWRGPALLEFAHLDFAWGFAAKLEERRLGATEDRIDADLRLGRHAAVIGELGELVAAHPLREGLRAHLALALYRSGRQAEALRVLDDARRTLRNQLGIDPGRPLRDLESAILTHDLGLELAPAETGSADQGGEAGGVETTPEGPAAPRAAEQDEPVRAAEPLPVVPVPPRLVGRDLELRQAIGSLDEARHATRIVVVEGEAGIGKTRLVEELAAEAATRGSPVLWGRAYEGGAAPALWPWLTPIRALVAGVPTGAEADVARELRDLVACPGSDQPGPSAPSAPAGSDGDGRTWADAPSRYRLFDAVTRLLSETVGDQPRLLVLDDLQWADIASLELLAWVSAQLVDTPLLLACTVRELEVGRNDAVVEALAALSRGLTTRRIVLRGLSHLATGELVEQASGRAVEPELVAAIQERVDGNPFFATELAQLIVAERGRADTAAVVSTGGDIPSGVRDVVRRRLALLPPTAVELLQVAAVIGRDVSLDLLTATAGVDVDVVIDGIEPALVHRLLAPIPDQPATFRFAHALLREAVADDVSPLRRARLHLRVADALAASPASGDDTAEILAEHLWDAVPVGVGDRAAEALERAAEVAVRRFAFGSAESLLERAVQLRASATGTGSATGSTTGSTVGPSTPAPPTDAAAQAELRTASRLLSIQRSLHGYASVVDSPHLARAKDLAVRTGRSDVLVRLLWTEWGGYNAMCDFARAEPLAERLYELSEQGEDPLARLTGLGALGTTRWTQGRITEAADLLDRAVEAGKAVPRPAVSLGLDLEVVALPYPFSVYMHVLAGDLSSDEAEAAFEELADLAPDRYAVEVMEMVASAAAVAVGDGDWAERAARRGLAADPDVTFSFWGRGLECYHASALILQGRLDEGLELIGPAIERFVAAQGRTGVALLFGTQSAGLARAGRLDEATAVLAEARREFESTGELFTEPLVVEAEAVLAHARGDDASAASLLERAAAAATGQGAHGVARRVQRTARELGVG